MDDGLLHWINRLISLAWMAKFSAYSFGLSHKTCSCKIRGNSQQDSGSSASLIQHSNCNNVKKRIFFHYIYCHGKFITNIKKKKKSRHLWPPIPSIKIKNHIVVPPFSPHIRHWLSLILIHFTPFIFHHLSSQSSALVVGTTTTLASS